MKNKIILLLIAASVQIAKAQDAYNFKETFDNNDKSWYISTSKKNSAEIKNGKYILNNIDSKKPILSMQEFPLDENKEITITVKIKKGDHGLETDNGFGIVFASKDEKNYYMFRCTPFSNLWVNKIEKGEWRQISPVFTYTKKEEHVLSVVLKPTEWKFYIDGEEVLKTDKYPFLGNKAGVHVKADNQCTFDDFEVKVQSAKAEPCPIPGNKVEIVKAIDKALCAVKNDFVDYVDEINNSIVADSSIFWKVKNLTFPGATEMSFAKVLTKKHVFGKELIVIYKCTNTKDYDAARYLYDQFKYLIATIIPSCTDKKIYHDKEFGASGILLKSDTWDVGMPGANKNYIMGMLELNLINNGNYMVVIHVYQRK